MSTLELSPPVFAILSGLIEERTGLHYGILDREVLAEKASVRALEAGFDSLLDYYYYLRYDPGGERELGALTDALVVGETYFFREYDPPLRVLVESFLLPWIEAGRRPRIWSAACATGEEPLTLAMMLAGRGLLDKVELVATDISARALARAREGTYGKRALRQVPDPALAERFLTPTGTGYRVDRALVEAIDWRQVNITEPDQVAALGTFDAVLCRNVLIYFRDETVQRVAGLLAERLTKDGVLLVGVSESLLRFSTALHGEEHGGAFVYRRAPR